MKIRLKKLITCIMTASILSQCLGGTISLAADRGAESVSADNAVVLEDNTSDVENTSGDGEEAGVISEGSNSYEQDRNAGSDNGSIYENRGDEDVITSTDESSDRSSRDVSDNGTISDNDVESDKEEGETVSGDNAEDDDQIDDENGSDLKLEDLSDSTGEKGVLEEELSSEPYIFNYDSFSVEWRVVSHWKGACNVSVSLTNRSDEIIHNWNLSFMSEDEIINPYNAKITSEGSNGNKWTFKNLEYNQDIRPGESIQFGFQVRYGERIDIPFSYSIDSSKKNVSDDNYEITNTIISSWNGGLVGEIHIVNNGETAIEDWSLSIKTEAVLVNVWGGNARKVSENIYEFRCPDYSQNIEAGQTAVIGYQLSGFEKELEVLGLNEWSLSEINNDEKEDPSVSNNSVSDNSISENSVSDNSGSDNTVSENMPVYAEGDGHQHIFIDSDEYELLDEGIYLLDIYSDSMTGYMDHEDDIESVKLEIQDVFEETIWEGDVVSGDAFETWKTDDIGFVLGANKLIFEVTFLNGTVMKEELIIINREASNIDNTLIRLEDNDGDNIYDYYEKYFGTDPGKKDTDGDGLDDGAELYVLYTDPLDDDTDDDGIKDGDEDEDGDGLSVLREYELGTSDLTDDFDLDELSDGYEVNILGTDPTLADTDFDGLIDKEELDLGLDPLNPDSDGDGILDGDEIIMREFSKDNIGEVVDHIGVNIECSGSLDNKVFISKANDKSGILHDTAGLIGDFYDIECDVDFETAQIVFSYDEAMLGDTDESDLRLIWYNDEDNDFVLLEDSVVDTENNTVSYTTTHFSKWGVVDSKVFTEAFNAPASPGMSDTNNPYSDNDKFKFIQDWYIISLDFTASPDDIEKQLQVTQAIIDQMDGYDYLNITCYGSEAQLTQPYCCGNLDQWPDGNWPKDGIFKIDENYSNLEEILDYKNNKVYIEEGSTYKGQLARELNRIALYQGSIKTHYDNSMNKKNYKVYVFYSGNQYDEIIEDCLDSPNQNSYGISLRDSIKLAAEKDLIINTISIASPYGSSEYMDELIPVTGGKSYSDADGTGTGISDLIDEVIKDLDDQKAAQRQGDFDGDGLSDRAELDGMLGVNGHIYFSNPYSTDVDHDSDSDGYSDNEEIEYDPSLGFYKVKSDPLNKNSIPSDYEGEPTYIIAWSYGHDEVKKFELKYKAFHLDSNITVDGVIYDWTDEMFEEYENSHPFSRAAKTKQRELIEKGIYEGNVKFFRIDGGQELLDLWNDTWAEYECIQELHIFSHGIAGEPEMYDPNIQQPDGYDPGTKGFLEDDIYRKLNFSSNAGCYFHACNVAKTVHMQEYANKQKVITYAYDTGSCVSGSYNRKTFVLSDDVYLAPYEIPGEESWRLEDNWVYGVCVVLPEQKIGNCLTLVRGRKPFCIFYPETEGED